VAAGVDHGTLLVEAASPAEGLLQVSDREGADLLVVGSTGHGSLAGRLLGSTSYNLTHHARQPTVVVPSDWR
jgi:nucleotide-binding universal stress UspA family protein